MTSGHEARHFRCPQCKHMLVAPVARDALVRCPECGTSCSFHDLASQRHWRLFRTGSLCVCFVLYLVTNAILVSLAAMGRIHPPWAVLDFFSSVGPIAVIAIVLAAQFATRGRAFHWVAVVTILALLMLAALLNLRFLYAAIGAV